MAAFAAAHSQKRKWQEQRSDKGNGIVAQKQKSKNQTKLKKYKYAVFMGYYGVEYLGMQGNSGIKTIKQDLCQALLQAELVTPRDMMQTESFHFQGAARTSKGVSAVRQVVSIRLTENVDVPKINANLCKAIRVFGIKRTTKAFNCKKKCSAQTYVYLLPTIAFAKPNVEASILQETFRLSNDEFRKINQVFQNEMGKRNYHNFISKMLYDDCQAKRNVYSFACEPAFVKEGVEFALLKIKGRNFLLHQVQKMVGLLLAIIKEYVSVGIFSKVWTQEKVNIPKAPSLGLVLEHVDFERYDKKWGKDGIHESLDWIEYEDEVNTFTEKFIYQTIIDTEIKEKSMIRWIEAKLNLHDFNKNESDDEPINDGEDNMDSD